MTLTVRGLRFTYPSWPPTLQDASLEVPAGTSGFLLGPSGSGKTTLLRCVAGLETPEAGAILDDGRDLAAVPTHKRRVGMLFQDGALFPHLPVWRNVAFGLAALEVPRKQQRAEALKWLALVGLEEKADAGVTQLSGGQKQRVALARTLAARPRIVLLDEPFGNLDRALRDELGPKVRDLLRAQGVAALWVTHDREEALRLGDRVWDLVDGRCVETKAP
ncbi:MAG: thiamine transport system ATP-binding protein [Thermoplasmata archaeon]|jgi:ABC-type Fe3+/spermidine/putrescine transport system ATPase subunit|nr:thiamine transport system ATP-binding protein [Thermoplasmata archaeon]